MLFYLYSYFNLTYLFQIIIVIFVSKIKVLAYIIVMFLHTREQGSSPGFDGVCNCK